MCILTVCTPTLPPTPYSKMTKLPLSCRLGIFMSSDLEHLMCVCFGTETSYDDILLLCFALRFIQRRFDESLSLIHI